jgi:hypothetical protein
MSGVLVAIGVLVIVAFASSYAALVSALTSGRLRGALLAGGVAGVAFAGYILIGVANNPG